MNSSLEYMKRFPIPIAEQTVSTKIIQQQEEIEKRKKRNRYQQIIREGKGKT